MNKAEAKRYVEGNITIIFMIICSSPSYIDLLQVLHNSMVFLLLNALYTNKARFFRARSFSVAKSNASRNSHGLWKYLGSINSYLKSPNAGQHRTKCTLFSTANRHNGHFKPSTLQTLNLDLCTLMSDTPNLNLVNLCVCLNLTSNRVQHQLMF